MERDSERKTSSAKKKAKVLFAVPRVRHRLFAGLAATHPGSDDSAGHARHHGFGHHRFGVEVERERGRRKKQEKKRRSNVVRGRAESVDFFFLSSKKRRRRNSFLRFLLSLSLLSFLLLVLSFVSFSISPSLSLSLSTT